MNWTGVILILVGMLFLYRYSQAIRSDKESVSSVAWIYLVVGIIQIVVGLLNLSRP